MQYNEFIAAMTAQTAAWEMLPDSVRHSVMIQSYASSEHYYAPIRRDGSTMLSSAIPSFSADQQLFHSPVVATLHHPRMPSVVPVPQSEIQSALPNSTSTVSSWHGTASSSVAINNLTEVPDFPGEDATMVRNLAIDSLELERRLVL